MKRIIVDAEKCTGCRYCELVCSGQHYRLFSPTLSRITVVKDDHHGLDYPVLCHQCEKCLPMDSCPVSAMKRANGCIVFEENCIGCGQCVEKCEFGAVKIIKGRPITCDLCGGSLKCVNRCPTRSLSYHEYNGGFQPAKVELEELQRRLGITG